MGWLADTELMARSRMFGASFVLTNLATRYEIHGREHLEAALAARDRGRGMISISNHVSLFDDPMVLVEMLGIKDFSIKSKIWWSTPCESNFSPNGKGLGPGFVRYFSGISNMVFFARPAKKGRTIKIPDHYATALTQRGGLPLISRIERAAVEQGLDDETFLRRYETQTEDELKRGALNQAGMIEACARVGLGDWLHFFPEGGRSRSLHLRPPKRGVGKVIHHNPDAIVLPFCVYGTQDVLPVKALVPRPFQKVVITIGEPFEVSRLVDQLPESLQQPSPESFQVLAENAWKSVVELRPSTLVRYMGPAKTTALLESEAPPTDESKGEPMSSPAESQAPVSSHNRRDRTSRRIG